MNSTSESGLEAFFDTTSFETIAETPISYITKTRLRHAEAAIPTVAIKSASTLRKFSKQPHDIVKELRLLRCLSHINVIELLGHTFERAISSIHFWMPYVSHVLADILVCPVFSSHPLPGHPPAPSQAESFTIIAKSLIYQITCGLAYLHGCHVAHRDIKPRNILVTDEGCVKLIDFGIAWTDANDPSIMQDDLWPEPPGKMCFDVSTGPYRAPELLFGATAYDAFATDIWSLGTTCAEFFTQLRLERDYEEYVEDSGNHSGEENVPHIPIVMPRALAGDPDTIWTRQSLFDSSQGTIGLAWSIFKIRGTPTERSWPDFKYLPDADKVTFQDVPPAPLQPLLPNLPVDGLSSEAHHNDGAVRPSCLDLLEQFLIYPPSSRLRPALALSHPWFMAGLPLLLPEGYHGGEAHNTGIITWECRTLRDLLSTLPLPTSK